MHILFATDLSGCIRMCNYIVRLIRCGNTFDNKSTKGVDGTTLVLEEGSSTRWYLRSVGTNEESQKW